MEPNYSRRIGSLFRLQHSDGYKLGSILTRLLEKNPIFHYSPIADRISRDRFREISRYLHFADNATLAPRTSPQYDRLGKIRPLLDYLLTRFSVVFTPGEDLAVYLLSLVFRLLTNHYYKALLTGLCLCVACPPVTVCGGRSSR